MKITEDLVKNKLLAGHTAAGAPVIMIETHGGLFACFAKSKGGGFETLATAPHKAILRWMCETKEKGIRWTPEFTGDQPTEAQKFATMRSAVLGPEQVNKSETNDYMVYDVQNQVIAIMDKTELEKSIKSNEIPPHSILRKSDCSDRPTTAELHPWFRRFYA
jgi:hypothetical protein